MTLRYADQDDIGQLLMIEKMCFTSDLINREQFEGFVKTNGKTCHMIVSVDPLFPKSIYGYILILTKKGVRTIIHSFGLKPTARGTGAGAALIDEACLISRNLGYGAIMTHVRVDSPHAIRRYRKSGFKIAGAEGDYYEDGCDSVKYVKQLG